MTAERLHVVAYRPLPLDLRERIQAEHTLTCADPFDDPVGFEQLLPHAHALIGTAWSVDERQLDLAPQLRLISSTSVGLDHVDLQAAHARGIAVCNTAGVVEECVADTAFGLMFCTSRRLIELVDLVRSGRWKHRISEPHFGHDVHGKTVGLLGFGGVGQAIARRAACGFGMPVLYHRRTPIAFQLASSAAPVRHVGLAELLQQSDFVISTLPLTPATRHFLGAQEFAQMKPGAIFINVGRGGTVDEAALLQALDHGPLAGAGLDVFGQEPLAADSPWRSHPRVVPFPHIGAATHETRYAMLARATANLLDVLAGRSAVGRVYPS
jgi:phosphogluconate 2-dehydrogenase